MNTLSIYEGIQFPFSEWKTAHPVHPPTNAIFIAFIFPVKT